MKTRYLAKKAMAVVLSVALLMSCMVFTGFSTNAAETQEFHYHFDDATTLGYFNGSSNNQNAVFYSGETYNGNANSVKCAYPNSDATGKYCAFSLPNNSGAYYNGRNNGQTVYLKAGQPYKATITYKVNSYSIKSDLWFAIGMGNLSSMQNYSFLTTASNKVKFAEITGVTDGWVTVTKIITTTNNNAGVYIVVAPDPIDATGRYGMEVLIGQVDFVPVSLVQITTNNNGSVSSFEAVVGDPLDLGTPTRDGYEFGGWYTDTNYTTPAPATVPATAATYYAKWTALSTETVVSCIVNGAEVATYSGMAGEAMVLPAPASVPAGYYFMDWYTDTTYTTKAPAAFPDANTSYYAKLVALDLETVLMRNGFASRDTYTNSGMRSGKYGATNSSDNVNALVDASAGVMRIYRDSNSANNAGYEGIAGFRIFAGDSTANYCADGSKWYSDSKPAKALALYTTVKYKAVNVPVDTVMGVVTGSYNWSNKDVDTLIADGVNATGANRSNLVSIPAGTVDTDWQIARLYNVVGGDNHGFHFVCGGDGTATAGTEILIDEIISYVVTEGSGSMITFDAQNGTSSKMFYPAGMAVDFPVPVRTNYEFEGWFTDDTFETSAPATAPAEDVTYVAKWRALVEFHTVTFMNGDKQVFTLRDAVGTAYDISTVTPDFGYGYSWTEATSGAAPTGVIGDADETFNTVFAPIVESFEGFETGDGVSADVISGNGSARNITEDYAHTGAKSLKIKLNESASSASWARIMPKYPTSYIEANPNTGYHVTAWVMSPEDTDIYLMIGGDTDPDHPWTGGSVLTTLKKEALQLTAGEWTKVEVDVEGFPNGNKLSIGLALNNGDANKFAYMDDLSFSRFDVYVKDEAIADYETATVGENKNLSSSQNAFVAVSNEMNRTIGGANSLKFWGSDGGGNTRAQALVTDYNGAPIAIKAGGTYRVSYWVYAPANFDYGTGYTNPSAIHRCWLAVADQTTPFSTSYAKNDYVVYEQNTTGAKIDEWFQVMASFTSTKDGYLRLGMSETSGGNTTNNSCYCFYVDDVQVVDASVVANVYSYEDLANGTDVELRKNNGGYYAKVTTAASHSGLNAVEVSNTAQGSGNIRAQMLLKYADGSDVVLTADHDYMVTFWARAGKTDQLRFWLAAQKTEGAGFTVSGDKDQYGLYKTGATSYGDYSGDVTLTDKWQLFTAFVTAKNTANDVDGKKILIGFQNGMSTNGSVYVDDFQVIDLTNGEGGMSKVDTAALFVPGIDASSHISVSPAAENSAIYTATNTAGVETEYAAIRLFGTYETFEADTTTINLNGTIYRVDGRGMDVYMEGSKVGSVSVSGNDLKNVWMMDDNTAYYSILVKNINAVNAAKELTAQTWVKVNINGSDVVLHSTMSNAITANGIYAAACAQTGIDYGWFSE